MFIQDSIMIIWSWTFVFLLAGDKTIVENEGKDEREESAYARHIGTVYE